MSAETYDELASSGRVGPLVSTEPATLPSKTTTLAGRYVDLVPLCSSHAEALFPLLCQAEHERLWDYMLEGPFTSDASRFQAHIAWVAAKPDMVHFAILDKTLGVTGYVSYLNIVPTHRTIEIGNVMFSPLLQRTPQATETIFLMIEHAFELGNRRVEWKCNNLNTPSKNAAARFGFSYEGLFRQAVIVKGRSRDTAWFSMIDKEWPERKHVFERWLDPENFVDGQQVKSFKQLREEQERAR